MEIVVSLNENYLLPAGVLLCSLFENNINEEINVHLFLGEGKNDFWQPLCDLSDKYHQSVSLYQLYGKISSKNIDGIDTHRYPIESYNRLFMGRFLPTDVHKVIYLDCDMVVNNSLHDLWEENIEDYAVGVVTDYQNNNMKVYERLGYDAKYGYFNAGMMLVNLDYWRSHDVISLFLDYIKTHSDILDFADQDVLNSLFFDKKKILPIRYNLNTAFLYKKKCLLISSDYNQEIEDAFHNPAIIHFTTDRPWFKGSPNPMLHYWEKYRDMTIWKGQTMKTRKKTFKETFIQFLVALKRLFLLSSTNIYDPKYL